MPIKPEAYSFLDCHVRDNVAFATMRHPNETREERKEWSRLIADVAADDEVHVLLITGWGNPKQAKESGRYEDFNAARYYETAIRQRVPIFQDLDKPIVMAIDGAPDVMTVPLSGDILIAERHLSFRDAHVLHGVVSATQPYLMPLNSGLLRAKRYILTGDGFTAEEALKMGIVTEVVDTGKSLERATEYAVHMAALRPETLQATKRVLNQWMRLVRTAVYEHGLALEFMNFPDRTKLADHYNESWGSRDEDSGRAQAG